MFGQDNKKVEVGRRTREARVTRLESSSPHSLLKDVKHIQRMSERTNEHTPIRFSTCIRSNQIVGKPPAKHPGKGRSSTSNVAGKEKTKDEGEQKLFLEASCSS